MSRGLEILKRIKEKEEAKTQKIEKQAEIEYRFTKATEELNKEYPEGAFAWCRTNRPDLDKRINEAEQAVDQAYKQANIRTFEEAVTGYLDVNRQIFAAYKEGDPNV